MAGKNNMCEECDAKSRIKCVCTIYSQQLIGRYTQTTQVL